MQVRDELVRECGLEYVPHVHADAVIGWAWSVFNDYDFEANPLGFRHRTVRALAGTTRRIRHLGLADSLGIDFHKTGFAPYISSAVLLKDGGDFAYLTRPDEDTPYIFQSGARHPGKYTLETTRAGGGPLAAIANLRLFGTSGLQALLGHVVTMAEELREHLEGHASTTVLNGENFGPVTLFRVYPDGVDTFSMPDQERTDPSCRDTLLGAQRLQPTHLRADSGRRPGRARRRHLADRLLPHVRLRRADQRAQVVHPEPVLRRAARRRRARVDLEGASRDHGGMRGRG